MNLDQYSQASQHYNSIEEIQARKKILRNNLEKDNQEIKKIWNHLFHDSEQNQNSSTSRKVNNFINTGASLYDGFMLGWKLYKFFRRRKK